MIGRNDPCLCGSGRKYKKCCLGKTEMHTDQLIDEELERVLLGIYDQTKERSDMAAYDRYRRQWHEKLGHIWSERGLQVAVTEYFLFIARQDLWKRYLARMLKSPMRGAVRSVVEAWQKPFVLLGRVISEQEEWVEVKELFGEKTYTLEKSDGMSIDPQSIVFGIALPNPRKRQNGIYVITSLLFIPDGNRYFEGEIAQLVRASAAETYDAFYREHMADLYHILLMPEKSPVEELINKDLTEVQREVLTMVEEALAQVETQETAKELLKNIGITYFLKKKPNFRKPNVIAAAIFLAALNLNMLGELTMTNAEVAKLFDVSTSSIKKHEENIRAFVEEMIAEAKEK